VANFTRDPKGYYVALGVSDDADEATIKAAFRAKAKRLHPDFNPSPIAAKQFNRLHEAYATLIDTKKRAAYDRPWKTAQARPEPGAGATDRKPRPDNAADAGREPPRPEPSRTEASRSETPRAEPPRAEPPPRRAPADAPVVCQCGQVTAQPRYVLFDMVWGRLRRVQHRTLSGVYCRRCADRTAIRASLVSWLAGWWAWPDGPRETVRALLTNIRGGRKPSDRNARLLLRQARAFEARGDRELAQNAALQARGFARLPEVRGEVERMIAALGPPSGRVLKDRWSRPGWAPMVQILPLAIGVAAAAGTLTMSLRAPSPRPSGVETVPPTVLAPSRSYDVIGAAVVLRSGPSEVFEPIADLRKGARVIALEPDATGPWLRVALPDGTIGFLPTAELAPTVAE
jgi:hypothetical protein